MAVRGGWKSTPNSFDFLGDSFGPDKAVPLLQSASPRRFLGANTFGPAKAVPLLQGKCPIEVHGLPP
jgi:hypothetical protein